MLEKRRIERINEAKESTSDTKYEDIPQKQEIFVYGFKHIKTDEIDNYILIACGSEK